MDDLDNIDCMSYTLHKHYYASTQKPLRAEQQWFTHLWFSVKLCANKLFLSLDHNYFASPHCQGLKSRRIWIMFAPSSTTYDHT